MQGADPCGEGVEAPATYVYVTPDLTWGVQQSGGPNLECKNRGIYCFLRPSSVLSAIYAPLLYKY